MLRHLKDFFRRRIPRYIAGIFFLLLVDILQLIVPQVLKQLTNALVGANITELDLWQYGVVILITGVAIAVCRFGWRAMISWSSADLASWLRNKYFQHLITMPQTFYQENKTGDLMARATNDLDTIRQTFSMGIIMSIDALFMTIATLVTMASSIDVEMTLLAIIPLPLMGFIASALGRRLHRKFRAVQEGFAILTDKVQESFSGIEVIKSFAQEQENLEDFNQKNQENLNRNLDLAKTHGLMINLVRFIGSLSLGLGLVIGGHYAVQGKITLGDLVAFLHYLDMLMWPMMAFGMVTNILQRGFASVERMNGILDVENNLYDAESPTVPEDTEICLRNLTFTYPGEKTPALQNLNLTIPAGSSLGILGHTGSGKSTIIALLSRLYNIPRGKVILGGVDINDVSIHHTREIIGSVPQDVFLFSNRIKDNIAFTDRAADLDMSKVVSAAQAAHIHEEISGFPEGYDTYLGERGVNLSGGQRQRTAIARLLYKDAPVMIFDDSLSAVDTKTESEILASLKASEHQRSSIVISHRVSSLRNLNHIIVLAEGKIVEQGTHRELMEQNGTYARLYYKQQLEEKIQQHEQQSEKHEEVGNE